MSNPIKLLLEEYIDATLHFNTNPNKLLTLMTRELTKPSIGNIDFFTFISSILIMSQMMKVSFSKDVEATKRLMEDLLKSEAHEKWAKMNAPQRANITRSIKLYSYFPSIINKDN